jgi:CRP-like cAMP-binding protein
MAEFNLEEYLTSSGRGRQVITFKKKQRVFGPGDPADSVYYIIRGLVLVSSVSSAGKEMAAAIVGTGGLLDELAILGRRTRNLGAVALVDSRLMKIKVEEIHLSLTESVFAHFFWRKVLQSSERNQQQALEQKESFGKTRLARCLLDLAKHDSAAEYLVLPRISHDILAQLVGATRQRVTTWMNEFRAEGWIQYNGGLRVHASLVNALVTEKKRSAQMDR